MTETDLLAKLRELGEQRERINQDLAQLSARGVFVDGQIAFAVELLGGPEKVKALLVEAPHT